MRFDCADMIDQRGVADIILYNIITNKYSMSRVTDRYRLKKEKLR